MRLACAILVMLLPAGAAAQPAAAAQEIYGYRVAAGDLVVRVPTGGCTRRNSFRVTSQLRGGDRQVTLARVRRDACKGHFPDGVEIRFGRSDFPAGGGLVVVNPVRLLPRIN